jgi:hypothetical protein
MAVATPWETQPVLAQCVRALERRAPQIVETARRSDVDIEYLGISPLFSETRLYAGQDTDWVLAPIDGREDAVLPFRERQIVRQLLAGIDGGFQLTYIAHETKEKAMTTQEQGHKVIDASTAMELVGSVPDPAPSVELGDRLAQHSVQLMRAARRAVVLGGTAALAVAAAPAVLVGGVLAGAAMHDPIILGAIPAVSSRPGDPAAFFLLARWDW